MKLEKAIIFILFVLASINQCFSQNELKLVNIGNLSTTKGTIIQDCKIGYRTLGKLNPDKSNVILWPTWFTGTTEEIINLGLTNSLINSEEYYIILVDALTNGVSSSPSNYENFPEITIRDMVNSQHQLLVDHLGINHIYSVMGFSLGGMQALEWTVAYPDFMDKAISICGTPKLTSRDILVLRTMANLLEPEQEIERKNSKTDLEDAHNIFLMNLSSPQFMASSIPVDSLDSYLQTEYDNLMDWKDYLGGIKAILHYDIYKNADSSPADINDVIKAEVLLISASQDHMLNPSSSINLSKISGFKSVVLSTDCGHLAPFCVSDKIREEISKFLSK